MRKLAALRNRSPFAGDQPLDSISLCVYGDSTGLRYWNGNNDPMPIKTLNNNGLKVYEETEDYFIQIDKDVVITTVEKYVPGTFYIYNERLKDVEKSRELLTLYKITWDANVDNAKLLLDINKEQLERLANIPSFLPESERPVLETRAIPTNYECCVRTDKKTGEIYIVEGYENLAENSRFQHYLDRDLQDTKYEYVICRAPFEVDYLYSVVYRVNKMLNTKNILIRSATSITPMIDFRVNKYQWNNAKYGKKNTSPNFDIAFEPGLLQGEGFEMDFQITKTSTHKPFVKTIMPNGKLEFLSDATELTHTFLTKGEGVITFGSGSFSLRGEKVKQLLVYEALLTEEQKQAEFAKDIKLK